MEFAGADRFSAAGVIDGWWARAMLADRIEEINGWFDQAHRGELTDLIPAAEVLRDR